MNEKLKTNVNRRQFLDILKTVAIYVVIFYHTSPNMTEFASKPHTIHTYIQYFLHGLTAVAVPVFFVVNGYLLLNKPVDFHKHLHKTLRIYLLTLAWSLITVVVLMGIQGEQYSISEFLKAVFSSKMDVNNHLWFLYALVSMYILLPVIKPIYDHHDTRIIYWLLSVLFVFSFGNLFGNWCINVLYVLIGHPIALEGGKIKEHAPLTSLSINEFCGYYWAWVYFIVGGLLGRSTGKFKKLEPGLLQLSAIFIVSLVALFIYGLVVSPSLDDKMFDTGWDGYYSIPGLLMTLSMFTAFRQIPHLDGRTDEIMASIGANTLGIYFVHMLLITALNPYVHQAASSLISIHLVYSALILLCSWGISVTLRRTPLVNYLFKL